MTLLIFCELSRMQKIDSLRFTVNICLSVFQSTVRSIIQQSKKGFHIIMKFKFYCKGLVLVLSGFDGSRKDITDIFKNYEIASL